MEPNELEDMLRTFDAIVWVADPRRGIRPQRVRAIVGQIARTAIEGLRRPRLVASQSDAEV
jgi:hypothetical protein